MGVGARAPPSSIPFCDTGRSRREHHVACPFEPDGGDAFPGYPRNTRRRSDAGVALRGGLRGGEGGGKCGSTLACRTSH